MATSAIRDAANGDELLDAIRDAHRRSTPRVISGREEARYGWLAIANSTTIEDGFGLDMGGGSIQAMRLEGRRLAEADSLPLGSVRRERGVPARREGAGRRRSRRCASAWPASSTALGWWGGGGRLVGIGGTIRNLAAAAMKRAELPGLDVQGFALDARRARGADRALAAGRPPSAAA